MKVKTIIGSSRKSLLWVTIMFSLVTQAGTLTQEEAKIKAEGLLGKTVEEVQTTNSRTNYIQEAPAYYLFNAEDGQGFVIMAADEEMGDILGYSKNASIPIGEKIPCGLEFYLNAYEHAVVASRDHSTSYASYNNTTLDEHGDAFLYTAEWGQGAPYNNMCPIINGSHCVTGCVATGLAELMYYWKWPVKGTGYSWATIGEGDPIGASLEHEYNWAAMMNTTKENLASAEASEAIAQLMYDCGLSVNMVYGTGGSGSSMSMAMKALFSYFGYNPNTLRILHKDCCTDDEWFSNLKYEIDAGRPVLVSAQSRNDKTDELEGHFFVIDGYDSKGMLHVNWGWDGEYNAYYSPLLMNPSATMKFNIRNIILMGITPAKNGETGTPTEYMTMQYAPIVSVSGENLKSIGFNVITGGFMNINANDHKWQATIGLFNTKNEMLADVKSSRVFATIDLPAGYYTYEQSHQISCKIPTGYPDGDYALRVVFRESGTQQWLLPDTYGGKAKNGIYIKMLGDRFKVTDGTDYMTSVSAPEVNPSAGQEPLYDLFGRKANTTRKGIYIQNGRKVVY